MVAIVTGRWQAYGSAVISLLGVAMFKHQSNSGYFCHANKGETFLVSFPSATEKEEKEQRSRRSDLLKLIISRHSHPERDVGAQDTSSDGRKASCHNGVEF